MEAQGRANAKRSHPCTASFPFFGGMSGFQSATAELIGAVPGIVIRPVKLMNSQQAEIIVNIKIVYAAVGVVTAAVAFLVVLSLNTPLIQEIPLF